MAVTATCLVSASSRASRRSIRPSSRRSRSARSPSPPSPAAGEGAGEGATDARSDTGVGGSEHRRVGELQGLALAQVDVHAAGQAGVEAANRPHDVDALELVGPVLLEDRRVLDRVLVGARGAVLVA